MLFIILPTISTFLTFLGIFINVRIQLPDWSTRTWVILSQISIITTLLILIEGLRRYDLRTNNEIRTEWAVRSNVIKVLSELIALGERLKNRCDRTMYLDDATLEEDITSWHRSVASALVYEAKLDESYRDRFYKRSDTGERTPPLNECLSWMHTRVAILKRLGRSLITPHHNYFLIGL